MSRCAVLVANLINMHAFIQINQRQTASGGGVGVGVGGDKGGGKGGGSLKGEDKSLASSSLQFTSRGLGLSSRSTPLLGASCGI